MYDRSAIREKRRKLDLAGKRFGTIVVKEYSHNDKINQFWFCVCDCGVEKLMNRRFLQVAKTCGCGRDQRFKQLISKHNLHLHPLYKVWKGMRARCRNPNAKYYHRYGGRGIKVCKEWDDFEIFLLDLGPRPKGFSINRIDNDGDYCKENCRWSSAREQACNRSDNKLLEYEGKTMALCSWARKFNLAHGTLSRRLTSGWEIGRALNTPVMKRRGK